MIWLLTMFNSQHDRLRRDALSHELFKATYKKNGRLEFVDTSCLKAIRVSSL